MAISELEFNLLQKEYVQLTLEQLTLEQYRFELCGSIHTWVFLNSKYFHTTQPVVG